MSYAIRELGSSDAAAAQELVRRFHSARVSEAYLANVLGEGANLLLVAELVNELVGFLFAHWIDRIRCEAPQLFIYEVEVVQSHRCRGVASLLVSDALARAAGRGARAFVFTNRSNPAAVGLYRKLGGEMKTGDDLLFVFHRDHEA